LTRATDPLTGLATCSSPLNPLSRLANSTGPQLDRGALLRLLGEMTWFPTALVDSRYVRWRIDGRVIEYVRWEIERIQYDVTAPF
jgi:hypothetical protein